MCFFLYIWINKFLNNFVCQPFHREQQKKQTKKKPSQVYEKKKSILLEHKDQKFFLINIFSKSMVAF